MDDIDVCTKKTLRRHDRFIKRTHIFGTRLLRRPFHAPRETRNMRVDRKRRNSQIEKQDAAINYTVFQNGNHMYTWTFAYNIPGIRDWLYLNVYTTDEERTLMLDDKLSKMSAVLGLFRTLLILVSIVIIALIVYVLTIEKIKSIATLKLIGAPNGLIVRLIMTQSMLLTLASFALAYLLRDLIAPGFPRTLAFVGQETAITFVVMLLGGVLASLMAVWHALRTPAQLALGG